MTMETINKDSIAIDGKEIINSEDKKLNVDDVKRISEVVKEPTMIKEKISERITGLSEKNKGELLSAIDAFSKTPEYTNLSEIEKKGLKSLKEFLLPETYSEKEYTAIKTNIIQYLNSSFGKGSFDAKDFDEKSFDKLPQCLAEKLIWDYYTTDSGKTVDIKKFIDTFKKTQDDLFNSTTTSNPLDGKENIQIHSIGSLKPKNKEDQNIVNDFLRRTIGKGVLKFTISGSADGTQLTSTGIEKIKGTGDESYSKIRESLFAGCTDEVKNNLSNIFPEFNTKNFPNTNSYNRAYALGRAMSEISFLSPDIKNILFSAKSEKVTTNKEQGLSMDIFKIGDVTLKIYDYDLKGDQYTFGKTEILPTGDTLLESMDEMINQLDNSKIIFRTELKKVPGNSIGKKYMGGYVGLMLKDGSIKKDVSANANGNWAPDTTNDADSRNIIIDENKSGNGSKHLTMKLTDEMMKKYPDYFESKHIANGVYEYKFKQVPNYSQALEMIKTLSNSDSQVAEFADKQLLCWKNYNTLNQKLAANPELRLNFSNFLVQKKYPKLSTEEKKVKVKEIYDNIGKSVNI